MRLNEARSDDEDNTYIVERLSQSPQIHYFARNAHHVAANFTTRRRGRNLSHAFGFEFPEEEEEEEPYLEDDDSDSVYYGR